MQRPYKDGTRIGQLIFVLVTSCASNLRISAPVILRSSATLFKHLQRTPRKDLVPFGSVCNK